MPAPTDAVLNAHAHTEQEAAFRALRPEEQEACRRAALAAFLATAHEVWSEQDGDTPLVGILREHIEGAEGYADL